MITLVMQLSMVILIRVYFSAWPVIKKDVEAGNMEWSKEICIQLYDAISDQLNESWPAFMEQAFHVPRANGVIIKGGRELIADRGIVHYQEALCS